MAPGRGWALSWAGAVGLTFVTLTAVEITWARHGHQPTVVDSPDLWAWYRGRIGAGDDAIVLIGGSRMQLDVDTEVMRARFPGRRVFQLAVDGTQPAATLRHLAEDHDFMGVIVADMTAYGLSTGARGGQQALVDHFDGSATFNTRLEARLEAAARSRLAFLTPHAELLKVLRSGAVPPPFYLATLEDRSRAADSSLVDVQEHRDVRARWLRDNTEATSPHEWLQRTDDIDGWVRAIQSRGGDVVFVRLPSTAESWAFEDSRWPRAAYWDRFAARTPAHTLHFADVPVMAALDCPDGSHLDRRDRVPFTNALASWLIGEPGLGLRPDE